MLRAYQNRGDLRSIAGAVVRGGAALAKRVLPGAVRATPIGTIVGLAGGAAGALGALAPRRNGGPGGKVHPSGVLPGGRPLFTGRDVLYANGQKPSGYHLNKADGKYGAKGTYYVRNRRMNPCNGRALRRSIKRINAGEKVLRRIFQVKGKGSPAIKPKSPKRRS